MSSSPCGAAPAQGASEPNHARRFATIWLVATVIALPLVIFVHRPASWPPGERQRPGRGQSHRHTPCWRRWRRRSCCSSCSTFLRASPSSASRKGGALEGPAVRGDARIQTTWIVVTSVDRARARRLRHRRLRGRTRAGSGSGPNPLAVPSGPKLPVQVIAQQWLFTYRYPTYGGVETTHLCCRSNEMVEFHVTSHRRDPLLLGVPARRQGRRQPGRRQRRVRQADEAARRSTCAARSCAASGTATCVTPASVVTQAAFDTWIHQQQTASRRRRRCFPSTARPTYPNRRGAENEHDNSTGTPYPRRQRPLWRRLIGFNLLTRRDPRRRRLLPGLVHRPSDQRARASTTRSDRRERRRAAARLLLRRRRLPDRPGLRQLSVLAAARPPRVAAREGGRGIAPLLRPVHRPQGCRASSTSSGSACSSSSAGSTRC